MGPSLSRSAGEGLSPRVIHQRTHPPHAGLEPREDRFADQEMADVELGKLGDGGDRGDIVERQPVTGVRLRNVRTGAERDFPCSGVFPFIGVEPSTAYLPAAVERDAAGRIVTDGAMRTSLRDVFAVGAVRAGYGGDLVSAAGEAALAVAAVARELTH